MTARRGGAVLALLLAVSLLTGCAPLRSAARVTALLQEQGYDDVSLEISTTNSLHQVQVSYAGAGEGDEGEQRRATVAAGIIWRELAVYFDELVFFVSGTSYDDGRIGYSRAGLTALFGPRPAALDERDVAQEIGRAGEVAGRVARFGAAAAVVLLMVALPLVALGLRRRRDRPRAADATPHLPADFDPADPWAPPR